MRFPLHARTPLDGAWRLFVSDNPITATTLGALECEGLDVHPSVVPGNLELDLFSAGAIPEPFQGMNIAALRVYENKHVAYARRFSADVVPESAAFLRFEGVDCLATYFLNGERVGASDNALVEHEFEVSKRLRAGENEIVVILRPVPEEAARHEYPAAVCAQRNAWESLYIRKAPHCFGWDIMPRAISAGLWRSTALVVRPAERITEVWMRTISADEKEAELMVHFDLRLERPNGHGHEIEIEGRCGDSVFRKRETVLFRAGRATVRLERPRLWWPRGKGDAALYDVTVRLLGNGRELDRAEFRHGVRTVRLDRTETTDAPGGGEFLFRVNGERVFVLGTNHVPLDAYHSRDRGKIPAVLADAVELGCNLFRCWGGNVYEDDLFFDLCDEQGILVWQDFAMACALHPQDETFRGRLAAEAVKVVKRLRSHACLALWAGDNEVDEAHGWPGFRGGDPNDNALTRIVLPDVVRMHDPGRAYLPSSPYIGRGAHAHPAGPEALPERHLWGARDNFKGDYYRRSSAHFASELGYHGCPSPVSVAKFISPGKLWPPDNDEWLLHATSPVPGTDLHDYRVGLMRRQARELFGDIPDNLEDFSFASQCVQAEALKFFIEHFRSGKWRRTGIVWWNLRDGWPQFSDAIVDYYGCRKRAFDAVRRSQRPLCLMMREPADWSLELVACNDTREDAFVSWSVRDLGAGGEVVASGATAATHDAVTPLGRIPFTASRKTVYHISWRHASERGANQYLAGHPPFGLAAYRGWMETCGLLDAEAF